jgi:hypothetical protein
MKLLCAREKIGSAKESRQGCLLNNPQTNPKTNLRKNKTNQQKKETLNQFQKTLKQT